MALGTPPPSTEVPDAQHPSPATDPAIRGSGLGGSDAGPIAGLSKYRTPLDVYLDKKGVPRENGSMEAAEWGTILEPVLLDQYAQRTGRLVIGRDKRGAIVVYHPDGTEGLIGDLPDECHRFLRLLDTLRHPEHTFMMCHLDGIALNPDTLEPERIIEAKTSSAFLASEWGDEGSDHIPDAYVVQCQHNAEVARAAADLEVPVDVPVLIGGQRWSVFTVERDPILVEDLIAEERLFWDRVERSDPPPPTPDERGRRALERLYPVDTGEEKVVSPEEPLNEIVDELRLARQKLDEWSELKTARENQIKDAMGELSKLQGEGWSISWKRTKDRHVTDYKKAFETLVADLKRQEHEYAQPLYLTALLDECTETKPGSRRFRATFKKREA